MKRLVPQSLLVAFILLNLSFLVERKIMCKGGSFFDVRHTDPCPTGEVKYTVHGWPLKYFRNKDIKFIPAWYALDYVFYFLLSLSLLELRRHGKPKRKNG